MICPSFTEHVFVSMLQQPLCAPHLLTCMHSGYIYCKSPLSKPITSCESRSTGLGSRHSCSLSCSLICSTASKMAKKKRKYGCEFPKEIAYQTKRFEDEIYLLYRMTLQWGKNGLASCDMPLSPFLQVSWRYSRL